MASTEPLAPDPGMSPVPGTRPDEPIYQPMGGMVPVMGGGRPLPDQTFTQFPSPNPSRDPDTIPGQDSGTPMNLPDYTGARVPGSSDTTNMFAPEGPNLPRRIPPVEYPATPGTAIRARKGAFGGRPPRRRGRRA